MTTETQERITQIMRDFDKTVYAFSCKPGEAIPFEFKYEGSETIQGLEPDCGCTDVTVENNVVTGILDISEHSQPGHQVNRNIKLYIEDGEPFMTVNDKMNISQNPNKTKINLRLIADIK